MKFGITLKNIQHVDYLNFDLDLTEGKLICLSGKNSVGKTTLFRAVRNLYLNNTFIETAAPYIFNSNSCVEYRIDKTNITFTYNEKLSVIDSRQNIPDSIKELFLVELPIPHGERFNQFKKLADIDSTIRAKIAVGDYQTPIELIEFLHNVYGEERFNNLKSISINNKLYYFILKDDHDRYYIREDYFSSGEYFLISLYRHINSRKLIIFIDEIDISLDSRAQVNLLNMLRLHCKEKNINIIFTTHSLALMKTLNPDELYYIENDASNGEISINNRSYNFVKSVLYGFKGHDKYILTEDKCLELYIRYIIEKCPNVFYTHEIIYVGGGSQVVDLIKRNSTQEFLGKNNDIFALLDGDQRSEKYHVGLDNVHFLPFDNIEVEILNRYNSNDPAIPKVQKIDGKSKSKQAKNLYNQLVANNNGTQLITKELLYQHLESLFTTEINALESKIIKFLSN